MNGFGFDNINALSSLLHECKESENTTTSHQTQPPVAGTTVVKTLSAAGVQTDPNLERKKDIWDIAEIPTEESLAAVSKDSRPCPKYEISYKQAVGTEDTFLGLSNKTPSSEDCTHLVYVSLVYSYTFN